MAQKNSTVLRGVDISSILIIVKHSKLHYTLTGLKNQVGVFLLVDNIYLLLAVIG